MRFLALHSPQLEGKVRALLVCSGGGHLKQLHLLLPRLGLSSDDILWATFDTALSRSLLSNARVIFIPYSAPRSLAGVARNARLALRVLRSRQPDVVISTGAHPALSFLPTARVLGRSCHYIESATRTRGPSMTGRLLSLLPGLHLYTQSSLWQTKRWSYVGSVFDSFIAKSLEKPPIEIQKVVVTVGTTETYGFRSLLERVCRILPADVEVLWQTGVTEVSDLPIKARASVPTQELQAALIRADVVVAHAGTGSALSALEAGKYPVLVPRYASRGEHIDDHQLETATELARRGLALVRSVDALSLSDLREAASYRVEPSSRADPIRLAGLQ